MEMSFHTILLEYSDLLINNTASRIKSNDLSIKNPTPEFNDNYILIDTPSRGQIPSDKDKSDKNSLNASNVKSNTSIAGKS